MEEKIQRYEEFINRLYKSEDWLIKNGYKDWEEVKKINPEKYQLISNLIHWVKVTQKDIHDRLNLNNPWNE